MITLQLTADERNMIVSTLSSALLKAEIRYNLATERNDTAEAQRADMKLLKLEALQEKLAKV